MHFDADCCPVKAVEPFGCNPRGYSPDLQADVFNERRNTLNFYVTGNGRYRFNTVVDIILGIGLPLLLL